MIGMAGLNILPSSIVAGESIVESITGVTVTGYSLVYQFSATPPISVSCTGTTDWTLTVTPAQTLTMKPSIIRFAALHTNNSTNQTTCVDSGMFVVAASPLATSQYSAALVAVDAAILDYAGNANKSLTLGPMSITYRSLDELLNLRAFYKNEIAKDQSGRGGGPFAIFTRFQ